MDWVNIIKAIAAVVIALAASGIIWLAWETTSFPSDPGTGY